MATVSAPRPPVKAEPRPFRPLLSAPQAAYWTDETGRPCVLLSGRRAAAAYELIPLSTDILCSYGLNPRLAKPPTS